MDLMDLMVKYHKVCYGCASRVVYFHTTEEV
jgi:hypothetical protein